MAGFIKQNVPKELLQVPTYLYRENWQEGAKAKERGKLNSGKIEVAIALALARAYKKPKRRQGSNLRSSNRLLCTKNKTQRPTRLELVAGSFWGVFMLGMQDEWGPVPYFKIRRAWASHCHEGGRKVTRGVCICMYVYVLIRMYNIHIHIYTYIHTYI